MVREEPIHGGRESVGIERDDVGYAIPHQVSDFAAVCDDHRGARQAGLHDRDGKGVFARGQHKEIGVLKSGQDIRARQQPQQGNLSA